MGKKRVSFWASLFSVFLFVYFVAGAYAIPVDVIATGDNCVYYYDWGANQWNAFPNFSSWPSSGKVELSWQGSYPYLLLAVNNLGAGSAANPAGLLAQVNVGALGTILSDSAWEVLAIPSGWSDVSTLDVKDYLSRPDWKSATWYAYNNGKINPDYPVVDGHRVNGLSNWYESKGVISPIDEDAQWIWTDKNFSTNMDEGAIFRVRIPSNQGNLPNSVVPEPANFILLLLGIMLVVLRRKYSFF